MYICICICVYPPLTMLRTVFNPPHNCIYPITTPSLYIYICAQLHLGENVVFDYVKRVYAPAWLLHDSSALHWVAQAGINTTLLQAIVSNQVFVCVRVYVYVCVYVCINMCEYVSAYIFNPLYLHYNVHLIPSIYIIMCIYPLYLAAALLPPHPPSRSGGRQDKEEQVSI
ncbi:hypothetical protein B484DRAFT_202002 [Ochromonadaceae sp. CCMP2298]|nr:hypothetical protein B484DRAFT_202002 [Ochromonadaceae sp. CCMP2298]